MLTLNQLAIFILLIVEFQVQSRFEVDIKQLPEQIDTASYSRFSCFLWYCIL